MSKTILKWVLYVIISIAMNAMVIVPLIGIMSLISIYFMTFDRPLSIIEYIIVWIAITGLKSIIALTITTIIDIIRLMLGYESLPDIQ